MTLICETQEAGGGAIDACAVTREQFICQAMTLLPEGELWSRPSCTFYKFLESFAACYYDQWTRVCNMRQQANPCTATDDTIVGEWSEFLLPECLELPNTLAETQELFCSFLSFDGQLTDSFLTALLASVGVAVTRVEPDTQTTTVDRSFGCAYPTGLAMVGDPFKVTAFELCRRETRTQTCSEQVTSQCCEAESVALEQDCTTPDCDRSLPEYLPCSSSTQFCCFPSVGEGEVTTVTAEELVNPWTVCVYIDRTSLPFDPTCCLPREGGITSNAGQVGSAFTDLRTLIPELCLLESVRPAHLNIEYKLEC